MATSSPDQSRHDLWRYREQLGSPPPEGLISLGEGMTPLLSAPRLGARLGAPRLYIKAEGHNPSGSTLDRGYAVAFTLSLQEGARAAVAAGYASDAASIGALSSRAGLPASLVVPEGGQAACAAACERYRVQLTVAQGGWEEACRLAQAQVEPGIVDLTAFAHPGRLLGAHTLAFELAEAFEDDFPEVWVVPVSGGLTCLGIVEGLNQAEELGWITSRRPRLVIAQPEGCAPLVHAYRHGRTDCDAWPNPTTELARFQVPLPAGGPEVLTAVREAEGACFAVPEDSLSALSVEVSQQTGLHPSSAGTLAFGAVQQMRETGFLGERERVLVIDPGG